MFRHFVHHCDLRIPATLFFLALVGCADEDPQAQIDSLRETLATVNSEIASLRASRRVLETRLAATQVAARTAGGRLHELNSTLNELTVREAALSEANARGAQRLHAAESALAQLEGQLAAAHQALNAGESRNAALSRQLAAVSGWLGQRDALGQSRDNLLRDMEAESQRNASSVATLSAQLRTEKDARRRASAEANQLRGRNAQLDAQRKTLRTKIDDLSTRSAQRIATLQRQRGESATKAAQRVATLEKQLAEATSQAAKRAAALEKQLAAASTHAAQRIAALEKERDGMTVRAAQRISALEKRRDELSARADGAGDQAQVLQSNVLQLNANNEQLKARMEAMRTELAEANDSALRYQVAKDYLIDKVQAQEATIKALEKTVAEARSQHKATIATMLEQQDELKTASQERADASQQALARAEALQAEVDKVSAQLERLRIDYTASEQRARDAKQAKDYLDGKLAATVKELEDARTEHRMALLKIEHALQLSLEESRVWQQRERGLREQLATAQQSGSDKADALRNELAAKVSAAEAKLDAAEKAAAAALAATQACTSARKEDTAKMRDLHWGNGTLLKEIEKLEERLRVLQAVQEQCKLQKT